MIYFYPLSFLTGIVQVVEVIGQGNNGMQSISGYVLVATDALAPVDYFLAHQLHCDMT